MMMTSRISDMVPLGVLGGCQLYPWNRTASDSIPGSADGFGGRDSLPGAVALKSATVIEVGHRHRSRPPSSNSATVIELGHRHPGVGRDRCTLPHVELKDPGVIPA
jgi:hypothetical protein